MNDRCAEHLTTLLTLIERGEEIPPELRSHLAACAECARLLDAMNRVQADIDRDESAVTEEAVVSETVEKSAVAVSRSSRARIVAKVIGVAVIFAVAAWLVGRGLGSPGEGIAVVGIAVLVFAPLFIVATLLYFLRQRLHEPGKAIYKRLKPGRQLDGVCLGLSEVMGVPVIVLRVIFLALVFVDGAGLWLYILFALLMPVHPDDRRYMLRFQIARAVRRMRG